MNLDAAAMRPETQRRKTVTRFLENHLRGPCHWTSTLELFARLTVCGSLDRSKLAPFILNSWRHRASARASPLSLCSSFHPLQYAQTIACTEDTITSEVIKESKEGTIQFLQMLFSWNLWVEEKRIVREMAWKVRKRHERRNAWRLESSRRDSIAVARREIRSSSLCHSFRRRRWPGLPEISVRGWWCIVVPGDGIKADWSSSEAVGTSTTTMWVSLLVFDIGKWRRGSRNGVLGEFLGRSGIQECRNGSVCLERLKKGKRELWSELRGFGELGGIISGDRKRMRFATVIFELSDRWSWDFYILPLCKSWNYFPISA